jgi:hypothetical protein
MGQHNRTVICRTCPATAPLKVAKANWKAHVGRGRGDSHASWTCPVCVERQRRPAPSLLSSIKLKPRQPSALAELAAHQRPRLLEAEELMKLGQASAASGVAREPETAAEQRRRDLLLFGRHTELPPGPSPWSVSRSMPVLRGRMHIIAAAAMLGLVGLPAVQRRDFSWLTDLRIFMHTQGSPCIGTISVDEAAQLGDHEAVEAMCEHGLTVVALPTHPQTHGDRVAVEIRIA